MKLRERLERLRIIALLTGHPLISIGIFLILFFGTLVLLLLGEA